VKNSAALIKFENKDQKYMFLFIIKELKEGEILLLIMI